LDLPFYRRNFGNRFCRRNEIHGWFYAAGSEYFDDCDGSCQRDDTVAGILTRSVAFILSGLMAVAYFMAHGLKTFLPIQNGGELAVIYCFVFLFLSVAGAGEWSLDRLLRKQS